jgi:hypothetical protein
MKLRLTADSIRLRLTPAEVAQLARTGSLQSDTAITGSSVLFYELIACDNVSATAATFELNTIRIVVPSKTISQWTGSHAVGIYASQHFSAQRRLKIIIEKDFECLDPAGNEPGTILYPNPRKEPM